MTAPGHVSFDDNVLSASSHARTLSVLAIVCCGSSTAPDFYEGEIPPVHRRRDLLRIGLTIGCSCGFERSIWGTERSVELFHYLSYAAETTRRRGKICLASPVAFSVSTEVLVTLDLDQIIIFGKHLIPLRDRARSTLVGAGLAIVCFLSTGYRQQAWFVLPQVGENDGGYAGTALSSD